MEDDSYRVNLGIYHSEENLHRFYWISAIDLWECGVPSLLADMIRDEPIPDELRYVIASIISGERQAKHKAAAKHSIPSEIRFFIAAKILYVREPFDYVERLTAGERQSLAEFMGVEVIEMLRHFRNGRKQADEFCASHFGVSVETVQNLRKSLVKKIKNYPNI